MVGDVVLRLNVNCMGYFSPIGSYMHVIGTKVVTLTILTSNTFIQTLNDWENQNLLQPIEPTTSFGSN